MDEKIDSAIFAGGCFWCMVQPFDQRSIFTETSSRYETYSSLNDQIS